MLFLNNWLIYKAHPTGPGAGSSSPPRCTSASGPPASSSPPSPPIFSSSLPTAIPSASISFTSSIGGGGMPSESPRYLGSNLGAWSIISPASPRCLLLLARLLTLERPSRDQFLFSEGHLHFLRFILHLAKLANLPGLQPHVGFSYICCP